MQKIREMKEGKTSEPIVSICCTAYNHEEYVGEAIEGFLNQDVDFNVEIVIHDDCSTDCTREVLREYKNQFPDLIKLILPTRNQWELGNAASQIAIANCSGKFVAICEADDFWTNPDKLFVQVETLRKNPSASGCFHSADDLCDGEKAPVSAFWRPFGGLSEYSLDDLLRNGTFASTASIMLRREPLKDMPKYGHNVYHMDFAILAWALRGGPLVYIDRPMSVYRRHRGGLHSTTYGAVASLRAIQSLIYVGHTLGLQNRASYIEGLRWRLSELSSSVDSQNSSIAHLEMEIQRLRHQIERSARSRWYRAGLSIDKVMRRFKLR